MIIVILYKARASLLTHFVDIHPYLVSCPLQLVFQFQHSFLYIPLVAYHNMLTTYRETLQENILKVSYSSLWLLHLELQLMTFIMLINDLRAYVIKKKYFTIFYLASPRFTSITVCYVSSIGGMDSIRKIQSYLFYNFTEFSSSYFNAGLWNLVNIDLPSPLLCVSDILTKLAPDVVSSAKCYGFFSQFIELL